MNTNRRIWTTACCSVALVASAWAKGETNKDYRITPFYLMPEVSINYSDNENTHFQDWEKMLNAGVQFSMGKEFSPLWGWRLSAGYHNNRIATNWRDINRDFKYHTFNDAEAFADLTFDFSDLVFRGTDRRRWKVMVFAGVGGAKSFNFGDEPLAVDGNYSTDPDPVFGWRCGVNVSYMLNDYLALALEGRSTMFQDRFNGVKGARLYDSRQSIGAGLFVFLGKRKALATPPSVVEPMPILPSVDAKKLFELKPIMAFSMPMPEAKHRRTIGGQANLQFPLSQTVLLDDFRDNTNELNKIRASIDAVHNDKLLQILSIELHGFASPEGNYANNTRLARGRVEALRNRLMDDYKFGEEMFKIDATPEDWDGLRAWVVASDIQYKEAVLAIIDNDVMQPDTKEAKLRRLNGGKTFAMLLKEVFPTLRHTCYAINYDIRQFTLDEAKELVFTHPDMLTLNEMFMVAQSFGNGTPEFRKVCAIAVKTYPDRDEANLNMACLLLEEKQVTAAEGYLNKVVDVTPAKTHAKGVIEALKGNYVAARTFFELAAADGVAESQEMLKQLDGAGL